MSLVPLVTKIAIESGCIGSRSLRAGVAGGDDPPGSPLVEAVLEADLVR